MKKRYKTILLFGAPGSGKGTQGKILGHVPGFYHLSCGEVFRTLNVHTELGKKFIEYSSRGELVPDDLTIRMWKENIHAQTILSIYKPDNDLLVLDGIPRNPHQAVVMDEHIDVLLVIHLMCSDKERMFDRLRRRAIKENRLDDAKEEIIKKRWSVYEKETFPVLEHYPKNIIKNVEALGSPAEVLQHILELVVPVQASHFRNALEAAR